MGDIKDKIFRNKKVMWAVTRAPRDNKFAPGVKKYSLDMEITPEEIAELKAAGVKIGDGAFDKKTIEVDGTLFLKNINKKELNSKGEKAPALEVVDADNNDVDVAIGNGSICDIKVSLIPTKTQTIIYLKKVRIKELVEYDAEDTSSNTKTAEEQDDEDF